CGVPPLMGTVHRPLPKHLELGVRIECACTYIAHRMPMESSGGVADSYRCLMAMNSWNIEMSQIGS
ncbi:MAG: hypothetical protein J7M34_02010, partial [Anaerolineae bacterium]|nr:hypothetical protein [Anaerolineae bacterium]